jgi:hypothetical protein
MERIDVMMDNRNDKEILPGTYTTSYEWAAVRRIKCIEIQRCALCVCVCIFMGCLVLLQRYLFISIEITLPVYYSLRTIFHHQ